MYYLLQQKTGWVNKLLQHLRFRKIKTYIKKEDIVCDLGCGDGSVLKTLSSNIQEGYGVDKELSEFKEKNLHFISGDVMEPLPLGNERFSVVLCLAVLEHLDSPEPVFLEARRILKRKGLFVLTTPAPPSELLLKFLAFILTVAPEKEIREHIREHKHYYSNQELNSLLKKHNFKILKLKSFCLGLNTLAVAQKKT